MLKSKNIALQKIESHEKLCRIMQKQTHEKINKLEKQIGRIEKILISCVGALLIGMGGMISVLLAKL
jgi:cell division protein FtsL